MIFFLSTRIYHIISDVIRVRVQETDTDPIAQISIQFYGRSNGEHARGVVVPSRRPLRSSVLRFLREKMSNIINKYIFYFIRTVIFLSVVSFSARELVVRVLLRSIGLNKITINPRPFLQNDGYFFNVLSPRPGPIKTKKQKKKRTDKRHPLPPTPPRNRLSEKRRFFVEKPTQKISTYVGRSRGWDTRRVYVCVCENVCVCVRYSFYTYFCLLLIF